MEQALNDTNEDIHLGSAEDNRQLALSLAQQAKREILIASYDLDSRLYSNREFADAVSAFVRSHRNAHLQILVWNSEQAVKHGHRLVELAQHLSSSVKIHQPDRVDADFIESYMVVDGTAYFRRPLADRFEGTGNRHAPLIARDLKEHFHKMWERSTPASEFRRLGI